MVERKRVEQDHIFVLHSYPYSESSLLLEVFSRAHGRLPLLAKGARRPRSNLRGMLMAFQPLLVGWSGRGEVRTLNGCEWSGGQPLLQGDALLCGFYLNELLLRLMAREDPHEQLFDRYTEALQGLPEVNQRTQVLRRFEKSLLKELGYAMTLDREADSGARLDPHGSYCYEPERGPIRAGETAINPVFNGGTLLAIAEEDYSDPSTLPQYKQLMRLLINHRLDRQPLHSRNVFKELQQL